MKIVSWNVSQRTRKMTRARYLALAVFVGMCCLGRPSAFAQSGPPASAYGGNGWTANTGGPQFFPDPGAMAADESPWYGTADEVEAAGQTLGPRILFDGAFVRVEYLNYTLSKPGNVLLGAPVQGNPDPSQPFVIFAPSSATPAGFTSVPNTSGMNLGNMNGIQVTGGLNLIDGGAIEVSGFM